MTSLRFSLISCCALLGSLPAHAGPDSGMGGLEYAADREVTRRENNLALAEAAMQRGNARLQANDLPGAYEAYREAVDLVPDGANSGGLRARALSRFSSVSVQYAEYLVSQGEYDKAAEIARTVLEPRYNPNYRPAAVFLSRLEEPDYFNKTVTPEFAQEREDVETLLREANGYFDSGRYDLAQRRYEKVLQIDKYNAAAYRGMEQVELGRQRYYDSAYNDTRSRMLWEVDKAWKRPARPTTDSRSTDSSSLQEQKRGTEAMMARLNRIIIPQIDFRDATVREAVNFLKQKSRDLDAAEGSTGERGVNIVLKMPANPVAAAPAVGGVDGDSLGAAPVTASPDSRISLNLTNVPLYEALRYVCTLAGLKLKVEPFAVSIVPLSEPTDTLEQRDFKVPPGFIASVAAGGEPLAAAGRGTEAGSGPRLTARQNARVFLESQGVEFPPGSSANFIPGSSRLVVRNTPSNLDLIESLVDAALSAQPTQVEIESKFVEVSQNNLKELGFDWSLGPFAIPGSDAVFGSGGSRIADGAGYPFVTPNGQVVGTDSVSSGLRTGTEAVSVNSLGALIAQNAGLTVPNGPAPGIFSIAGVFTNPQFQLVIRALNQKKGVDLMAAPKVTTKSGQKATITISREFPYPQEFEPPQVPQNTGSGAQQVTIVGQAQQADPIVTPSFPTDFTTRNLGVTLEVEPQIGPDGYTIDMQLSPEVVDFDGFINYGSPIFSAANLTAVQQALNPLQTITGATFAPQLLTENTINQPIFSTRKVTTNVSIWDGQTIALGGLIREDIQKVNDKVPILGDVPLAGVFFRSQVDQKIKRNLIIFVTARLMDAAGQPLRPEDDQDQVDQVEPLGLPASQQPAAPKRYK